MMPSGLAPARSQSPFPSLRARIGAGARPRAPRGSSLGPRRGVPRVASRPSPAGIQFLDLPRRDPLPSPPLERRQERPDQVLPPRQFERLQHELAVGRVLPAHQGLLQAALAPDAPESTKGFLLNPLISDVLPGSRRANADPVTGQAAWYDLRVRIAPAMAPDQAAG